MSGLQRSRGGSCQPSNVTEPWQPAPFGGMYVDGAAEQAVDDEWQQQQARQREIDAIMAEMDGSKSEAPTDVGGSSSGENSPDFECSSSGGDEN